LSSNSAAGTAGAAAGSSRKLHQTASGCLGVASATIVALVIALMRQQVVNHRMIPVSDRDRSMAIDPKEAVMKLPFPQAVACLGAASLILVPSLAAQTPARLTDKDVKTLLEAVDHGRGEFEGRLDGKVKDSILREPGREVPVRQRSD
jgi:hypothetical protein